MFDKDVGANWHLRFRLKLEELQKEYQEKIDKEKILRPAVLNNSLFIAKENSIIKLN